MKNPLGVSPSKANQGTTRGNEKIVLTSVGIKPTTSGLDLPWQREGFETLPTTGNPPQSVPTTWCTYQDHGD